MGSHAAGKINDDQLEALEAAACPGPGACGGQFTANTMAMAGEFLGISPMMITGVPAMSPEKLEASRAAGRMVMDLARSGLTPRTSSPASPSRTPSPPSRLRRQHQRRPPPHRHRPRARDPAHHGGLRPHQRAHALHLRPLPRRQVRRQGLPGRRRLARPRPAPHGTQISYDDARPSPARPSPRRGRHRRRDTQPARHLHMGQAPQAHRRPRHPQGQPRPRRLRHQGRRPRAPPPHRHQPASSTPRTTATPPSKPARSTPATSRHPLRRPQGWPRHARDARRHRRHQRHSRTLRHSALLTDGRFSGATRGLMAGHVAPEAFLGGPIAAVHEGDTITFDIPNRELPSTSPTPKSPNA